ncbi:melanocortin-2 receptor accessory protein 2-like isoform X1 [Polypterus senegalus]
MSEYGPISNTTSSLAAEHSDYVWEYEYYDEPVSFEGLKAHRYSIVIGFWVGLAVFVIFMFFVLTLLTKTGAPHQENPEPATKRHCLHSFAVNFSHHRESEKESSQHLEEARSLFHCYINEVDQIDRTKRAIKPLNMDHASLHIQESLVISKLNEGMDCLTKFNIPNFVNSEPSSMLGDDDLLICEQPIIMDSDAKLKSPHEILS